MELILAGGLLGERWSLPKDEGSTTVTPNTYELELQTVRVVCSPPPESISGITEERADEPEKAAAVILAILDTYEPDSEVFGFVALDARYRVTGFKVLTVGTHTQAPVDGNKLFRCALELSARGIVAFHTHPSGEMEPSRDDLELTRRLVLGGNYIGVAVHDHLIVSGSRWMSLRTDRSDIFTAAN